MFTVSCGYTIRTKKQKPQKKSNQVKPEQKTNDLERGRIVPSTETRSMVIEDYTSSGDERKETMKRSANETTPPSKISSKSKNNTVHPEAALKVALEDPVGFGSK